MRILIQHPHRPGELSGVLTYVSYLRQALEDHGGVECRVISTKESGLWEQLKLVAWADVVQLNSNCLFMTFVARVIGRRTLIKLHYLQFRSTHFTYRPMTFIRRFLVEIEEIATMPFRGTGVRYASETLARLVFRLIVTLSADRIAACSGFLAQA